MTENSEFLRWFLEQFGARPGGLETDEYYAAIASHGVDARLILKLRHEYDRMKQAALYAWQARNQ